MLAARVIPALALITITLTLAAPARAEDTSMFVTVGGSVGVGTTVDGQDAFGRDYDPEGTLQLRLTASWEPPPLAYKEPKGYRVAGALIPEVTFGYLRVADHRTGDPDGNTDAYVAIGGRLEARVSQRKIGLLEVSARGGFYLAGRVGLMTDADRTPLLEVAVGEHLFLGDRIRIGGEFGVQRFFGQDYVAAVPLAAARAPWRDGDGQYLSFHATVFVGWKL
ncbi:MAG: hypothetical protein IPL61_29610 [Myxococcales bacterium]|nr:hypothetical protein [Myxococcales bacterium]